MPDQLQRRCGDVIPIAPDGTVDRKAAAVLVDRSPHTLRNWELSGESRLKCRKVRGRYRYHLDDIQDYLEELFS